MPPSEATRIDIRTLCAADIVAREDAFLRIAADIPSEYWTLANFLYDLPGKWNLSFAAWRWKDPIGYAILSRKSESRIHLHHFMIDSTQRGRGLGARMMCEIVARSSSAGAYRLTLKVKGMRARKFYQHHGFSKFGVDGNYTLLERALSRPMA